jgi:hypothetical protein
MQPLNTKIATSIHPVRAAMLLSTLALAVITTACSTHTVGAANSPTSKNTNSRPATPETAAPGVKPATVAVSGEKPSTPRTSKVYRSRDYGVSFVYPWQYTFVSAKAVATGDTSLRPKSDGHDGQLTLARIEVPKGFYSDTDYESGYFTLSLNQNLDQQACESLLGVAKDGKPATDTINGADFRWIETDSGGRGSATKVRQYVTFTSGTCYEVEMGVKTKNDNGLAREVNPDKVLGRLDAILRTMKIQPAESTSPAEEESSTAGPASASPQPQSTEKTAGPVQQH